MFTKLLQYTMFTVQTAYCVIVELKSQTQCCELSNVSYHGYQLQLRVITSPIHSPTPPPFPCDAKRCFRIPSDEWVYGD